ncbi:hypothetical protein HZS_5889 [Henneguya salminicola]|nr:hypothetical protein HZS_5889 [Henneguya salminicola]
MSSTRNKILAFFYVLYISISTFCGFSITLIPLLPLFFISPYLFRRVIDSQVDNWICINVKFIELFGTKLYVYSTEQNFNKSSLIIMNHKNRLDWFYYFIFSCYHQSPRNLKIALKNSLKYIPGPGWACQLGCYLFLNRKWEIDKIKLQKYISYWKTLKYPLQLLIFCEGTNLCDETKISSNNYARKNDLPLFDYVLHPRTTGLRYLVNLLDGKDEINMDSIYDVTVAYKGEAYGELDIMSGNFTKEVHMHIERIDFQKLPKTDDYIDSWLRNRWILKEASLKCFYNNGHFINNPPLLKTCANKQPYFKVIVFNLITLFCLFLLYNFKIFRIYFTIQFVACFLITYYIGFDDIIIKNY